MNFIVLEGSANDCHEVMLHLPEFSHPIRSVSEIEKRLTNKSFKIGIAKIDNELIGFKIGYQQGESNIYSWLGGVLPQFRQNGVAAALAQHQEEWAKSLGFKTIRFKTRNKHIAMLRFSLKRGFKIVDFETKEDINENRIILEKVI